MQQLLWIPHSQTQAVKYLLKSNRCNRYICDSDWLAYKSSKIHAHSVAIAQKNDHLESFLKWFKSQKPQLNLTNLAESGKPSTSGKKGPHRKASTKKGAKYIQDILSWLKNQALRLAHPGKHPLQHLQHLHYHQQHLICHLGPLNKHLYGNSTVVYRTG